MSWNIELANFWVDVSLAVTTFLATLVALFGNLLWDFINRPKINFVLSNKEPYVVTYYNTSLLPKLFRLKVVNSGRTVAKNCKIKILSLRPSQTTFEPDVLKWSNAPRDMSFRMDPSRDIEFSNIPNLLPIYKELKDIAPNGGWEFCDLFLHGEGGDTIRFSSLGSRNIIAHEDSYIIEIELSGENIKPTNAKFKISNLHKKRYLRVDWIKN